MVEGQREHDSAVQAIVSDLDETSRWIVDGRLWIRAESAMLAKQTVSLEADQVRKAMRMVDLLEDLDDVQRVTTNVDIPEDVLAELAG